jgi:predicted AAA+ superfamily ATPase
LRILSFQSRFNNGLKGNCYFWRDHKGSEIDCIIEDGQNLIPVEIKAARTVSRSFFSGLNYWKKISGQNLANAFVVYGGDETLDTKEGKLIGWKQLNEIQ